MSFAYDLSTNRGKVRLLIQDTDETYEFYSDAEIDAFLTIAGELDGDFESDDVMFRVRLCLGGNYLDPRCAYAQVG